jgi:hypothetical protein
MAELSQMFKDAAAMRKRTEKDLAAMLALYTEFSGEVDKRFREEYSDNGGRMEGLEDFFALNNLLKRNLASLKNAFGSLKMVKPLDAFEVSEKEIEDKKVEAAVKGGN